jgi:hypothetical protein
MARQRLGLIYSYHCVFRSGQRSSPNLGPNRVRTVHRAANKEPNAGPRRLRRQPGPGCGLDRQAASQRAPDPAPGAAGREIVHHRAQPVPGVGQQPARAGNQRDLVVLGAKQVGDDARPAVAPGATRDHWERSVWMRTTSSREASLISGISASSSACRSPAAARGRSAAGASLGAWTGAHCADPPQPRARSGRAPRQDPRGPPPAREPARPPSRGRAAAHGSRRACAGSRIPSGACGRARLHGRTLRGQRSRYDVCGVGVG